jgi:hypothetical protein
MYVVLTDQDLKERRPLADGLEDLMEKASRLAEHNNGDIYIAEVVRRVKAVTTIQVDDMGGAR